MPARDGRSLNENGKRDLEITGQQKQTDKKNKNKQLCPSTKAGKKREQFHPRLAKLGGETRRQLLEALESRLRKASPSEAVGITVIPSAPKAFAQS